MDSLTKIGFHSKDATGVIEFTNFRSAALISPAIAWLLSGSANMDRGTFQVQDPKITQTIDFGPVQETISTNVAGDGSVSTQVKEEIAELGIKAAGAGDGEIHLQSILAAGRKRRSSISASTASKAARHSTSGACLAAHPARPDLAAHEAELKGLLKEIAAPGLKLDEGIEAQKTVITASLGAFALGDFKYQLGAANAGPQSAINLTVSADGLSLPVGTFPQRGRVDSVQDRCCCDPQGHRYHRGGQRADLRPQPAGRRTPPLRRQREQGRGRLPKLRPRPNRVCPLAYPCARGRRGLLRRCPP